MRNVTDLASVKQIDINYSLYIDPTGHWRELGLNSDEILDICKSIRDVIIGGDKDKTMLENIEAHYHFNVESISEGITTDEGLFIYPGSPDIFPLILIIDRHFSQFYLYHNGIMAFIDILNEEQHHLYQS